MCSLAVPSPVSSSRGPLGHWAAIPAAWMCQFFHNAHGILRVLDITRFRPLPTGLIDRSHPWVTGLNPATGLPIWHENTLYQSPRSAATPADAPADPIIVQRVCRFLAGMAARSAVVPEVPWGPRRRMPHAINYIHGAVHYHSGILVLNDFADGFAHFSDRRFVAEVRRFAHREKRELLVLFRSRSYTPRDYAYFIAFLRSTFPWFCNSNGPRQRVMWGNASPFPAVNIIAGNWIRDLYRLKEPGGAQQAVRPPIPSGRYFRHGEYGGSRREAWWLEKLFARFTQERVRLRGSRGGLFFVDRRHLFAERLERLRRQRRADRPIAVW